MEFADPSRIGPRMKIFISAGEPSGDSHGERLIHALRKRRPDIECVGFGGPKMARAGCHLLRDMMPLALMAFLRVYVRLPTFLRLLRQTASYFREHRVDAVILIDYPGFNWCVARRAKRCGIPVFYYGAPQIWAWAPWRVHKLRRLVDCVLCQLPFEPAWYSQRHCATSFVGHPFFDELDEPLDQDFLNQIDPNVQWLVLLPGSRWAEVKSNAECFLRAAEMLRAKHPQLSVAVACYSGEHAAWIRDLAQRLSIRVTI